MPILRIALRSLQSIQFGAVIGGSHPDFHETITIWTVRIYPRRSHWKTTSKCFVTAFLPDLAVGVVEVYVLAHV